MVEQVSSLKTGVKYKETPIGKIPVDWEVAKLSELAIIKKNSIVDGDWIEIKDQSSSGYRLLQVGNIRVGQLNLGGNFRYVSEETIKRLNCTVLQKGYLLISRMPDPIGRACLMEDLDYKCITVVDCTIVKLDPQKVDSSFVVFSLNSQPALNRAKVLATGTTRQRISRKQLEGVPLIVPSLPEQKKIAEILTTVDDAIEKTNQIIDKTKELKKGLMQRLLTRGIGHKKFKKTEIGEIPVEWDVGDISGYGDIITGNTPSTSVPQYYSKEYPFASPFDLGEKKTIIETAKYLSKHGLSAARALPPNAVLVVCIGSTIGKTGVAGVTLATNQQINSVICNNSNFNFVYYYMSFISKKIKLLSGTQAVPIINKGEFSKIRTAIPPIDEQRKIGDILSSIDNQMEKESNHKDQLNLLKKGLMQVLLTGKLRVTV